MVLVSIAVASTHHGRALLRLQTADHILRCDTVPDYENFESLLSTPNELVPSRRASALGGRMSKDQVSGNHSHYLNTDGRTADVNYHLFWETKHFRKEISA